MVRTLGGDPLSLARPVARELHLIDSTAREPRLVAALETSIRDYISPQRFTTTLLAAFAFVGLALAAAGVFGVMRYWVASRTGEIGIRLALGAQRSDVLTLVFARAATAAIFGIAAGLAGAVALCKVLAAQLMGVGRSDPQMLAEASALIFAVALLAALIPAVRGSRVDPGEALRWRP
jgi:ABC-type antimicrobial peptide transport system permease subunit